MKTRRAVLIVFARRPQPGRVKRRLARTIGPRRAAQRYARLLDRALDQVGSLGGCRRILACAHASDRRWFAARLSRRGWRVRVQQRGDLGERMAHAIRAALREAAVVVLCGSDILDSSREDFEQTLRHLRNGTDVVLGPVADGGYWLLGVREEHPALFKDIAWSTSLVFEQSVAACSDLSVHALPLRHDLDRGRDLLPQRSRACSRSSPAT